MLLAAIRAAVLALYVFQQPVMLQFISSIHTGDSNLPAPENNTETKSEGYSVLGL